MTLHCATTNPGKLAEFRLAAERFGGGRWRLEPLPGQARLPPCPETGATFEENAIQKVLHYGAHSEGYLFADDSGLAADGLGGAPGVYSSRFAGPRATDAANNALLLERLKGAADRRARFVCVVALARAGRLMGTFAGTVEGELIEEPRGTAGFGYDPLFFVPSLRRTLAEVDASRKLEVSHRGLALAALFRFLNDATPSSTPASR